MIEQISAEVPYVPHTVWQAPVAGSDLVRKEGAPLRPPAASGKLKLDARSFVACPKCGAEMGEACTTGVGLLPTNPHAERVRALAVARPDCIQTYRDRQCKRHGTDPSTHKRKSFVKRVFEQAALEIA